jgi:hypothetical protein
VGNWWMEFWPLCRRRTDWRFQWPCELTGGNRYIVEWSLHSKIQSPRSVSYSGVQPEEIWCSTEQGTPARLLQPTQAKADALLTIWRFRIVKVAKRQVRFQNIDQRHSHCSAQWRCGALAQHLFNLAMHLTFVFVGFLCPCSGHAI